MVVFSIAWLTYLTVTLYAIVTRNTHRAKTLYFIFVLVLILNVHGCAVDI